MIRKFVQNNFLILILMNLGNVFAYLFQVVIARVLSAEDFGAFNALNSLAVVIAAPVAVLPVVFSRYTVQLMQDGLGQVKCLLTDSLRLLFLLAVFVFIVGLFALPWLRDYLHLEQSTPILIILFQLVLSLLFPVLIGVLQGLHRFSFVGMGGSGFALFRLFGAIIFVYFLAWSVNGALFSSIFGILVGTVIVVWGLKDVFQQNIVKIPQYLYKNMAWYALPVFICTSMMTVLGNLDITLVRHYCSAEEAGLYATAAILGRIALFLPGVLLLVLFPTAAKASHEDNEDQRILWLSIAMTALLGGGFSLICWLFPEQLIGLLFGSKYLAAAALLQKISLAMALLAVANVVFMYSLARHSFGFLWFLVIGVISMLAMIFMYHDTAEMVANILLYSIAAILLFTIFWFVLSHRILRN
jgi:O-antigen/teichoic acid export membrane protein